MTDAAKLQKRLLDWYDRNRREMPWRAGRGVPANPYHVWLSEVMLQQTTVAAVIPYFLKFIAKWPTVETLAAAQDDAVMAAWAGLGYYARARNLLKCARAVAARGGVFPDTEEELLGLPGVGPYTAAAVASIAFDRQAVAVDGNVERVTARMFAVGEGGAAGKKIMKEKAALLAAKARRPGDFTQAFMELGATVCAPRAPQCGRCPWKSACAALREGAPEAYPVKAPKKAKPLRRGAVFWIQRANGDFCIEKRTAPGLYEGMFQLPTGEWHAAATTPDARDRAFIRKMKLRRLGIEVRHSLTHFDLVLDIWGGTTRAKKPVPGAVWVSAAEAEDYALPSLMRKAVRLALVNQA